MATDYDAPRKQDEEQNEESYEELNARRSEMQSGAVDEDENSAAESFELPGADLSNEELNVVVLPAQDDEFTCASCFLVRHRSQIAREEGGLSYCIECTRPVEYVKAAHARTAPRRTHHGTPPHALNANTERKHPAVESQHSAR